MAFSCPTTYCKHLSRKGLLDKRNYMLIVEINKLLLSFNTGRSFHLHWVNFLLLFHHMQQWNYVYEIEHYIHIIFCN